MRVWTALVDATGKAPVRILRHTGAGNMDTSDLAYRPASHISGASGATKRAHEFYLA